MLLVLATLVYLFLRGWEVVSGIFSETHLWECFSILFLLAVYWFWLLAMPLSPYPSHLSVGLGDPPGYYRAAANLVAGRGWSPDYFIGDYLGGYLTYIKSQPLLVLITTFFFQIFDVNWFSLYVYDAMTGVFLLYLLSSLICLSAVGMLKDRKRILLVTMLVSLIPAHFMMLGLGAVTVPASLAFLMITALATTNIRPFASKKLVIGASATFLILVRPEALALALITGAVYLLYASAKAYRLQRPAGIAFLTGLLLFAFLVWIFLPEIIFHAPSAWKGVALSYLQFKPDTGRFVPMFSPWWELNHALSRANFLDEAAPFSLANPDIGIQLRNHPLAFLIYLVSQLPASAMALSQTIGFPPGSAVIALLLLAALVIIMLFNAPHRPVVAIIIVFLLFGSVLNPYLTPRHLLTVSPVVIGLSVRTIIGKSRRGLDADFVGGPLWRWRFAAALVVVALLVTVWNCGRIVNVRTAAANNTYRGILEDLERLTSPYDVVASSYPQLVTCVTGRRAVGATWLVENISQIVKGYSPDFIVVDNARGDLPNYTILLHDHAGKIRGYEPLMHNPAGKYIIFRSTEYKKHASRHNPRRELSHVRS
jgi:hypothetical protein